MPTTHPFQTGNFAPVRKQHSLTSCEYHGSIPQELLGGQYIRNGSNPLMDQDANRAEHWFDGDGMLSGVFFRRDKDGVSPEYVNQYVITDVFREASAKRGHLRAPILPSIATLVDPASSLLRIVYAVLRTVVLVLWSFLSKPIRKISVANTHIVHHDGRVLATCESGPPMRMFLPQLRTVGWFDGWRSEGEGDRKTSQDGFGGSGLSGFLKEWTTGHPRVDPQTGELILYHSTFIKPFVQYSVVPSGKSAKKMLNIPVPGVASPKMMHDFGVSKQHTIIFDIPLSLDPFNIAYNKPIVEYNRQGKTRFGVFPRHSPEQVHWFETEACVIFHGVNSWDESSPTKEYSTVNTLVCRMKSAGLIFQAGNIKPPLNDDDTGECRLYYYQFDMNRHIVSQQWALSAIPFEFPHVPNHLSMSKARYIYGCSTASGTFGQALGAGVKIDCLVKVDVAQLLSQAADNPPSQVTGCVDTRSMAEVLESTNPTDPIRVFRMPHGWYAQECSFVSRHAAASEDDGFLLTFVFDEAQLDANGCAPADAQSELWVIDAREMKDAVARIVLPQRVPYGMHGNWFSEDEIIKQRSVERFRSI